MMRLVRLSFVFVSMIAPTAAAQTAAHNCYPLNRTDNAPLVDALALGIDNIEIDLGWNEDAKRLIVGHDPAPRSGVSYPTFETYLVPALEAHWKAHPPGNAPKVLTIDWKTGNPDAIKACKLFLDAHRDWFSSAPKSEKSPLTPRRLTVCFTGSDAAKDVYDALVPPGGVYRGFRDRVFGAGAKYEEDVAAYVPSPATAYHRFLTCYWGVVERGGPSAAGDWTQAEADRLAALINLAHAKGFRLRFYCLNGHTGNVLSGYRCASDEEAKTRWLAVAKTGAWVASDEYREIADALKPRDPVLRVADLEVGETSVLELSQGMKVPVRLDGVDVTTDPIRSAVRSARVRLTVAGLPVTLSSGNYELPVTVGQVQVDCPVVGDYRRNTTEDHWGLEKAARVRVWPAGSPWIDPETFAFPLRQRWLAGPTQMANEPVYVDGGEQPKNQKIYYHSGLDMGGAEGMVDVVAATDGFVISSGNDRLPGREDLPLDGPRYDVVNLLDDRGWYYRYSHLKTIEPEIRPGAAVKKGQKLGVLGKEGGSGGWSHLHFEVKSRQPSGKWGTQEGYAFLWQAAIREFNPDVIAVARPHRFVRVGDPVNLDGSKSWCRSGNVAKYEWTFTEGLGANVPKVERSYDKPGAYSEILKVTDSQGHSAYDFAIVQVIDPARPDQVPPTIHASYFPTTGVRPGDPVTFKVRTFRTTEGEETWDFGDGSPTATTHSDGNAKQLAPDGYAVTTHSFAKPGDYLVRVERTNNAGMKATGRLHVRVE